MLLLPSSMTRRASVQTSASRQPPPTVPMILPSGVTSILLFSLIGSEPLDAIIVDMAAFSPCSRISIADLKTSSITVAPSSPDAEVDANRQATRAESFSDHVLCSYYRSRACQRNSFLPGQGSAGLDLPPGSPHAAYAPGKPGRHPAKLAGYLAVR